MKILSKVTYASLIFVEALALALFNYYVFFDNTTNHTGLNPYWLFLLFVPIVFISFPMIRSNRVWVFPLILALVGSMNVIAFDLLNIMKEYEPWIHSGMPARPTWSCFHECSN